MDTNKSDDKGVQLTLFFDPKIVSIGEPIQPRLRIRNTEIRSILIEGFEFDWDLIAFAKPNLASLIGPDGENFLLPYEVDESKAETSFKIPVIEIKPASDEWLFLPISNHLHLRQPGNYNFKIELVDESGAKFVSNSIDFTLVDVAPNSTSDHIKLELSSATTTYPNYRDVTLEASFTNNTDRPLIFLKPQEDSFDGWVNPTYQFTVIDERGRSLALARRDGTMATPDYSKAMQIEVKAGATYLQKIKLPVFPHVQTSGKYQISLTYLVRDKASGKSGAILDRPAIWPVGTFVGRLESNQISIQIA